MMKPLAAALRTIAGAVPGPGGFFMPADGAMRDG